MSLRDLVSPSEVIKTPRGNLEVNGLTLEDLSFLIKDNLETVTLLMEGKANLDSLLNESPRFCASVIAAASGNRDEAEYARKLPLGVQLSALHKIWELTVPDEESLKNFWGHFLTRASQLAKQESESSSEKVEGSGKEDLQNPSNYSLPTAIAGRK